jgi:hypothetical protein
MRLRLQSPNLLIRLGILGWSLMATNAQLTGNALSDIFELRDGFDRQLSIAIDRRAVAVVTVHVRRLTAHPDDVCSW